MTKEVADAFAVLERTPQLLDVWLRGMPAEWLDARTEGPESFSPRDVLGHLISGERRDWIPRLRIILEHGEQRAFDPFDRFGFRKEIASRPAGGLLDEFSCPVTLGQLLATWVVHDLSHLGQIARVMAKRYSDAVGPWKAYLPVLTR